MRGTKTLRMIGMTVGALALSAMTAVAAEGQLPVEVAVRGGLETQALSADWVVKSADNICGVSKSRQITNPAKVDYDKLLEATSEMKELKRKGIDRTSARGQALVSKATDKVREAAKTAMTEKGHCSVWKKISHKQSKTVVDLTDAILLKLK